MEEEKDIKSLRTGDIVLLSTNTWKNVGEKWEKWSDFVE